MEKLISYSRQGKAWPGKARQGKARQGVARHGKEFGRTINCHLK